MVVEFDVDMFDFDALPQTSTLTDCDQAMLKVCGTCVVVETEAEFKRFLEAAGYVGSRDNKGAKVEKELQHFEAVQTCSEKHGRIFTPLRVGWPPTPQLFYVSCYTSVVLPFLTSNEYFYAFMPPVERRRIWFLFFCFPVPKFSHSGSTCHFDTF